MAVNDGKPNRSERMLRWFEYEHLTPDKQEISKPFGDLARWMVDTLPMNPERTVALRFVLQAKDCAVRAHIEGPAVAPPIMQPQPADPARGTSR